MAPRRNKLATPEQLDRALYVTTPKAWLALLVLLAMASAVVYWAVVGEVASYVKGNGIFLTRGGAVFDAASVDGGTLVRIIPSLGDTVKEGEVVAEIHDAETTERLASALALASERSQVLRDRQADITGENALVAESIAKQRANLEELERTGHQLIETAQQRLRGNQVLFEEGLVAETVVEESQEAVDIARRNLFDVKRRRDELESEDLRRRNELKIRLAGAKLDRLEATRQVKELETLIGTWQIRAPVSGRVTAINAQVGAVLAPGQSVLGIETGSGGLDVLMYVSPLDGKRVQPGMPALVSPTTLRHVEYGYMTGTVEAISDFPASLDSMTAILQNQDLAERFSETGPPYFGRIALKRNPATASSFAWTSLKGAEVTITAGTLAEVEIEVHRQSPVSLVAPMIKEKLGY